MVRLSSQEQNGVDGTIELSFQEDRGRPMEEPRWLRISPALGSTVLQQLLHFSIRCRHNYALGAKGMLTVKAWAGGLDRDRWSGTQGYSCMSCARDLCLEDLESSPRDPTPTQSNTG